MLRYMTTAAVLGSLLLPTAQAAGQASEAEVMAELDRLRETVVRIRTIADLRYSPIDQKLIDHGPQSRPYSVDGTGVVVGTTVVDGNTEYLILTNHHVADASNYVLEDGGYLRVNPSNTQAVPRIAEESFVVAEAREAIEDDDIRLIELVRRVQGDMTLMRTDGAHRALPVFQGEIGYRAGEIVPGARVATSGYPWGGEQMAAVGSILEVEFPHELGMAHDDFVVDLPVEPGQSGGPLFVVEEDATGTIGFRLIGLIHAKDRERNYAVPYDLWSASLPEFPTELAARLIR